MGIYRNSILLELREYSPVEYNVFKNADLTYPTENKLLLTIEDSVPARSKAEELVRILDKIYNERFGFSVDVEVAYKESKTAKHREDDELKIARQVAEISARPWVLPVERKEWQLMRQDSPKRCPVVEMAWACRRQPEI